MSRLNFWRKSKQGFILNDLFRSLKLIEDGDQSEMPSYMYPDEWKNYLTLEIDQILHPPLQWCDECETYHVVEFK